jgi:hypothetical protein
MTNDVPESAARAFDHHDAFESSEDGYRVTTTAFEGVATAADAEAWRTAYTVTIRAPTLERSTVDEVGDAVADGWFDTLQRRLEDAPKATRTEVDLDEYAVERDDDDVLVTYGFELGNADTAARVAKTFVEYVEGTYVEGIVPGYEYEGPVAELVDQAQTNGDGGAGGTPL